MSTLGCAAEYTVTIAERATGRRVRTLEQVTSISWARRLDTYSETTVELTVAEGCCGGIAGIHPGIDEVTVWRDTTLVWQGLLVRKRVRGELATLTAYDYSWLFERRLVQPAHVRGNDVDVAQEAYFLAFDEAFRTTEAAQGGVNDDPNVKRWMRVTRAGVLVDTEPIPAMRKLVSQLMDDLADQGMDYTTVGRSIRFSGEADADTPVQAWLRDDHFGEPIGVVEDLTAARTRITAATDKAVAAVTDGPKAQRYLVLDESLSVNDPDEKRPLTEAALARRARQRLRMSLPPLYLIELDAAVPLLPEAPVTINQLVCGLPFVIQVVGGCMPITRGMRLAQVTGTWAAAADGAGGAEQINVAFTPLKGQDPDPGQLSTRTDTGIAAETAPSMASSVAFGVASGVDSDPGGEG